MAKKSKSVKKRLSPISTEEQRRRAERQTIARALRSEKAVSRIAKQLPKAVRRREQDLSELVEVLTAMGYGPRDGDQEASDK
jgi:hypothetical protein